jgi:hypothetical protein
MHPYLRWLGRSLVGSALVLPLACGGGSSSDGVGTPGGTAGAAGSGGGSTIGSGGGLGSNNDASLGIGNGGATGTGEISEDAACAKETQQGERIPLSIYVLLDSSASMLDTLSDMTTTKWDAIKAALATFVKDPASTGLKVGLQYFPIPRPDVPARCTTAPQCGQYGPCLFPPPGVCGDGATRCSSFLDCHPLTPCYPIGQCTKTGGGCFPAGRKNPCPPGNDPQDNCDPVAPEGVCAGRDYCDANVYATPAIEVAPLPGVSQPIVDSMGSHMPDGFTPTYSALQGGFDHAKILAQANMMERVVILLATDGFPTECDPNNATTNAAAVASVATLASTGAMGTPAISTFVVGVFAPDQQAEATMNLNAIATAGATNQAFIINTTQNVQQAFLDALNKIRGSLLSCEFKIPVPPDGGQLDYGTVNVRYTSGAGQSSIVGHVADRQKCDPQKGGWYYDVDPVSGGMPTKIQMCDATCAAFQADTGGSVQILLGCETIAVVN